MNFAPQVFTISCFRSLKKRDNCLMSAVTLQVLWHNNYLTAEGPVLSTDVASNCTDVSPYYGILSTPVIANNSIWFVTYLKENGTLTYRFAPFSVLAILQAVDYIFVIGRQFWPSSLLASSSKARDSIEQLSYSPASGLQVAYDRSGHRHHWFANSALFSNW